MLPHHLAPPDEENPTKIVLQWKARSRLVNQYWVVFSKQYLATLVPLSKWLEENNAPVIGERVLVGDGKAATFKQRLAWPVGVITKLLYGRDNKVRSAVVQTPKSVLTRSATQLYRLEAPD